MNEVIQNNNYNNMKYIDHYRYLRISQKKKEKERQFLHYYKKPKHYSTLLLSIRGVSSSLVSFSAHTIK